MKAEVSDKTIILIGVLVIGVFIFITTQSVVGKMISEVKYYEAKLSLIGLRNNILFASVLETGRINYEPIGKETYTITLDVNDISVDVEGISRITLPHYASNILPATITAEKFCVSKTVDSNCNKIVVVCEQDEPCCAPQAC